MKNRIHFEKQSKAGQTSKHYDSLRLLDEMPLIFGSAFVSTLQNKADCTVWLHANNSNCPQIIFLCQ